MNKAVMILAAVLILGTGTPPRTVTASDKVDKTSIVGTDYIVISAMVETIDQERRTVTLKGPSDKTVTVKAAKSVKKFSEIKKGDPVTAEYLDSVVVIARKPDGKSHPGYLKEVRVTPHGKDSDGLPVDTLEAMVTVEDLDHEKRIVTFKAADGTVQRIKVDERVKKLRNIQKGDKIFVRYTEPLAVRITPVPVEK
jgi:hypothetical protein